MFNTTRQDIIGMLRFLCFCALTSDEGEVGVGVLSLNWILVGGFHGFSN